LVNILKILSGPEKSGSSLLYFLMRKNKETQDLGLQQKNSALI